MELSLALEKPCYYPGEVLKCLVKVRRLGGDAAPPASGAGGQAADVLQLLYECSASERVDPSWVGALFRPEVTAAKEQRRLVRRIFSTGQVPLLEGCQQQSLGSGREFIVRCRLPTKLPPSYRGAAVRFVYQVSVVGRLVGAAADAPNGASQQQPLSCQAQSGFVVWPLPERCGGGGSIERRSSLPAPGAQHGRAGAASGGGAAPADAPLLADVEQIDYRFGMQPLKLRWEEVVQHADGTRSLLHHQPAAPLYPARSGGASGGQALLAGQLLSLESLQLEGQQQATAAAAAAGAGGGDDDGDGEGSGAGGGEGAAGASWHLTPAQRASAAVRTFNLRAGDHPLLRLVLQPPTDGLLQPGGSFGLLLDFRDAHGQPPGVAPQCLQVVALLETEELVLAPHSHARGADAAASRKLYAEQAEVTAHLLTAQFVFSIPLTAPPSFRTPMVAHRWLLRFELTLAKPKPGRLGERVSEQLLWALPLVVWPPPPHGVV